MPRTRVREIAESQGLSMYMLQKRSGVSMGTVRRYWYNTSNGRDTGPELKVVALDQLGSVAKVLGVSAGDLLEDTEGNNVPVLAVA